MAQTVTDPAPPPCAACKTYLRSEPSHIALNEWLKMFDEHHRIIVAKDAEIAELREFLKRWDKWHANVIRAALAPKEKP